MTAIQHYTLRCDAAGCDATFSSGARRADATRADAAVGSGWVHKVTPRSSGGPHHSLDFCDRHHASGDASPVGDGSIRISTGVVVEANQSAAQRPICGCHSGQLIGDDGLCNDCRSWDSDAATVAAEETP